MKSFFISNNLPIVYFLGSAIEVNAYFNKSQLLSVPFV